MALLIIWRKSKKILEKILLTAVNICGCIKPSKAGFLMMKNLSLKETSNLGISYLKITHFSKISEFCDRSRYTLYFGYPRKMLRNIPMQFPDDFCNDLEQGDRI